MSLSFRMMFACRPAAETELATRPKNAPVDVRTYLSQSLAPKLFLFYVTLQPERRLGAARKDSAFAAFVSYRYQLRLCVVQSCPNNCSSVSLTCGQTSAENCTYITMSSVTSTSPDPCTYTICRCSSDVCRIRFDFMVNFLL